MNRALRLTKWLAPLAALFALACALFAPVEAGVSRRTPPQNARATPQEEKPPEESVVHGRVVYDDTTRPVRRARVMLVKESNAGRSDYAALTDARGDFAICCVRAGAYYAYVDVPGVLSPVSFVSLETFRASSSQTLELGEGRQFFDLVEVDGKQDVTVTVHARRGASIAGRVTYADGDPAVNAGVNLLRRSADGRVQKCVPGATAAALSGLRTDDRGMFRLSGLAPGEYLIGVNETMNHGLASAETGSTIGNLSEIFRGLYAPQLLMTFYPSATSLKEAGVVKVGPGDERDDVDIRIPERDLRLVGGVARARRGGRPVRLASVTISRRDDPLSPSVPLAAYYEGSEFGQNSTTTSDEGRWWFVEIPDGAYTITVKPPEEYEDAPAAAMNSSDANANNANTSANRPPRPKRSYAPTRVNLDVSGGDVTEFVVEVADGARVTGTVTVEGGKPPGWGSISMLRLGEAGAAPDYAGAQSGGLEGGRFAVEGLPAGRYVFHPDVGGVEGDTYLKSINWNGRDLLREPLEVAEGVSVEGVRVVYSRNPATLNVSVRAAGRREPSGLFVILLPVDLSAWSPLAQAASCTTSEEGTCVVTAAPGEYRVLAMRTPAQPAAYEQEVRRRAAAAPRVTLREGEPGRVQLDAPGN